MKTLRRTTIRLEEGLKKQAMMLAVKKGTSFQQIVSEALWEYLEKKDGIVFRSFDLGEPINRLTRDDIYGDPFCEEGEK